MMPLIVVVGLLVAALLMNPGVERHRAAFKARFAAINPIAGSLGVGALVSMQQQYHSIAVLSYTDVDQRVATVGAFDMVFVVMPDSDLDIR